MVACRTHARYDCRMRWVMQVTVCESPELDCEDSTSKREDSMKDERRLCRLYRDDMQGADILNKAGTRYGLLHVTLDLLPNCKVS